MQTDTFFENLEGELAPYTDEQVDSLMSATEANLRYRSEIWLLYVLAVLLPTSAILAVTLLLLENKVDGVIRVLGLIVGVLIVLWACRLLRGASERYAQWRYQASFLRELTFLKAQGGR